VAEIAAASNEQAQGVAQITTGLAQVDQVTQQNTAHAEESASSSVELTSQAQALQQLIGTFTVAGERIEQAEKLPEHGKKSPAAPAALSPGRSLVKSPASSWGGQFQREAARVEPVIALDDEEFGKY
jgi:methyl-accepting chemotaxis protein